MIAETLRFVGFVLMAALMLIGLSDAGDEMPEDQPLVEVVEP